MNADRIYKNLGKRIRDLRKKLRFTQDRLAKSIGISRASLANIEAGRQQVLVHHLFALANALDLESPALLLLTPRDHAAVPQKRRGDHKQDLPIAGDGLTEKQRHEVLSLMSGVLENNGKSDKEDA